jgi:adenosylcobinamide-GDP ribazoletransferase
MNRPVQAMALAGRAAHDVLSSLRFFTRLPLPTRETGPPDWARIAWSAPLAGAIVGAIGGLALVIADELSFPPFLAATFAIAALVLTTGALHEDGLADVADGFGGGSTREAKLAIMRDSRIGVFGAIALVLSLMLRVGALAALQREGTGFAFAGLMLANAAARSGALTPLAWLPPARLDGAGASAGRLDSAHLVAATLSAVAVAFVTGLWSLGVVRALFACALAAGSARGLCALARRQIGGQTGDVAGAAAQLSEVASLCALLIGGRGA